MLAGVGFWRQGEGKQGEVRGAERKRGKDDKDAKYTRIIGAGMNTAKCKHADVTDRFVVEK